MSDIERLVVRAEQLEKLADETAAPDHKRELLELAAAWREVAARVARVEARAAEERAIPRTGRAKPKDA